MAQHSGAHRIEPATQGLLDELVHQERALCDEAEARETVCERLLLPVLLDGERHAVAEALERVAHRALEHVRLHLLHEQHVWRVVRDQLVQNASPAERVVAFIGKRSISIHDNSSFDHLIRFGIGIGFELSKKKEQSMRTSETPYRRNGGIGRYPSMEVLTATSERTL